MKLRLLSLKENIMKSKMNMLKEAIKTMNQDSIVE